MTTKVAAKKTVAKIAPSLILIRKKEAILLKEITFLEKNMSNYKSERKASWKAFKSKMEIDLNKIKHSIEALSYPTE